MATVKLPPFLPPEAQFRSATAFPQYIRTDGTNMPVTGLAFDATTSETCFWEWVALDYGSGNITCDVQWYADTASSGGIVWQVAIAAITPNTDTQDAETKAFATAQQATDTHLGTTGQRLHSQAITISNLDSVASGDFCWLRLARLPADAGDTMTGDGIVKAVLLSYSDT